MTGFDFIPVRRMPVLFIPDIGVEEHGMELRFRIATASGVINVTGRHNSWYCTGCAEALALAGLINTAWLPGLEGNNKVSQTVCFGESGPELYRGNPSRRLLGESIRIKRLSADRFEVVVQATDEQATILGNLRDKEFERMRHKNERKALDFAIEEYKAEARNATPDDVKTALAFNFECFCRFVQSRTELAGFQFDAASARAIDEHLAALSAAFQSAVVCRALNEFTGNVVPFVRGYVGVGK